MAGYEESQAQLANASKMVDIGENEEEDQVPNQNKKNKEKGFLEWIFGWIIDPITTIIDGIISIVMFVINAIKFCINLPWCAKWYVFGFIGSVLYLIPSAFFFVFGLKKIEKKIFKIRDKVDDFIVCNTGYNILRYSNEIRDGCYFQKPINRNCERSEDFDPIKDISDMILELFSDLTTFNFITVVNILAILLFVLLVIIYFSKPFFQKSVTTDTPV